MISNHLNGVPSISVLHLIEEPQGDFQTVLIELSKLPRATIVAVSTPHPDTTLIVQHIFIQVRHVRVVTTIIW